MGTTPLVARRSRLPPVRRSLGALLIGLGLFASLELLAGFEAAAAVRPYSAAWGALAAGSGFVLVDRADLRAERWRPPPGSVEPTFCFWVMAALVAWNLLAPPLDARMDLTSPSFTGHWVTWIGCVAVTLGGWLSAWAVHSNPYYSLYLANQVERGHRAVSRGPYRWVRHPGYSGMLLTNLAAPLAGGSLLGLLGAGPYVLIVLRRTFGEDRWAERELRGYQDYAESVRWRLVPGLW